MAHDLAGLKRIFRLDLDAQDNPTLIPFGEIDVSQMANNGTLPRGTRKTIAPVEEIPIAGRAFDHQSVTFFTFSQEDRPGAFLGKLVIRQGIRRMVVGGFSRNTGVDFSKLSKKELEDLLAQQEEPWVITKP